MQDPQVLEVCTDVDHNPKHGKRLRYNATVRFGAQSHVDLVHLSAPRSPHHVQRWRRIGNPTKLISKVLMLDSAVRPANTNWPGKLSPQRGLTKSNYQTADQQLLKKGKVEYRHDRPGGTINDQYSSRET